MEVALLHGIFPTQGSIPGLLHCRHQFLGQEDSLKAGTAIHSSILALRLLWTEEPGGLQSMGSQRVRHHRTTEQARMLSATTPQSRALSWKAIFQIHVHTEGDLGRVGMAWLSSAVLLAKAPCLLQWGSKSITDTRAAPPAWPDTAISQQ